MYYFKNSAGETLKLRFAHKGGKKGSKDKPGRPPKFTVCKIIDSTGDIISTGLVSPVREVAEIVPGFIDATQIPARYGKRLLRTVKADSGEIIALLRGDSFCRERGRYLSARQALLNSTLDKQTRQNAIYSLLGFVTEEELFEGFDDEDIIELTDIVEHGGR